MNQYETIFVIDSLLKNNEIDEIIKRYERFISANGGSISEVQRWGKRRLAYEIKKRQYGYYVYVRFEGPGTVIKPLEREFTLNESILRYLSIALDTKALKAEALKKQHAVKEEETAEEATVEVTEETKTQETKTEETTNQETETEETKTQETETEETG